MTLEPVAFVISTDDLAYLDTLGDRRAALNLLYAQDRLKITPTDPPTIEILPR